MGERAFRRRRDAQLKDAKARYEDALREKFFGF